MKKYSDFKPFSKDQAYWERNQLVLALSKIYPSWIEDHPSEDKDWDDDWRTIIFIEIPVRVQMYGDMRNYVGDYRVETKQLSWHIHDSEKDFFNHLDKYEGNSWDGHTSEEKYERLSFLHIKKQVNKKWYQFWK